AIAPQLTAEALPLARRTLAPFGPLLWLLGGLDKGLHTLVAAPRPLEPDMRAAQRDMLLGVFTLADTTVDEVMTPRLDMVAVDVAATAEEVRETFHQSEHSRLPVYDGTPDNLIGIVYAKDLVPLALGVAGGGARAPRRLHGGRAHLFCAGPRAATGGRADARRVSGRGGARRPAARDPRLLSTQVTLALLVLGLGLLGASVAAAVGVAAA